MNGGGGGMDKVEGETGTMFSASHAGAKVFLFSV